MEREESQQPGEEGGHEPGAGGLGWQKGARSRAGHRAGERRDGRGVWGGIISPIQLAVFVGVSGLSPQFHSPVGLL